MMEIVVTQEEGRVPVTVFQLKGDLANEEPLRSQATEAYEAGTRNLILDLSDVPYITSSGLRAIHYLFDLLRSDSPEESDQAVRKGIASGQYKSPHLKLVKPSKNAAKALSISGYDMFLEVHKNKKEALASF
jgi:anti-anti-sigma factor